MSKPILILWSILSFIISGMFVFNGLVILQSEHLSALSFIAAAITFGYGLATIYFLSQAWARPNKRSLQITRYFVIITFIAQVILTLDAGPNRGPGWEVLLVIALMLGINWLSIKKVTEYKKHN